MSTPLKPPLEWQSAQVSCTSIDSACVRFANEALPKLVTCAIAVGELWHAVQVAAFGEMTRQPFGSVTPDGLATTEPSGPWSTLYELSTWQALQLMPTPGQATSAA